VIKHQLSNGLRVVAEPIPAVRSVSIGIWVKTGSRYEEPHRNGISHLIEHMLFKGTERYTAKDIADVFDGIGGNVNAFTSKEYTCYYAKVLDIHLPVAVEMLAEMVFHSIFEPHELDKEKNVIYEEIAMYEDTPDDFVHDLIALSAYRDHALGASILGTEEVLAAIKPDDIRDYMRTHYLVENMVISLAGHIPPDFLDLLERYFGAFRNHGVEPATSPPVFYGDVQFRAKDTEQNHICLALPGHALDDERTYAMTLLNNVIGGGMSSRLFQEIREKKGLAYSVYSYHTAHLDSGLFTIYIGTMPKQTREVLDVTLEVLHELVRDGVTEQELARGKEQLKGSMIIGLESSGSRMNRLGKNELLLGRHQTIDEVIEKIERVTQEELAQLIRELFASPFAVAMVGNSDESISRFRRDPLVLPSAH
jgi:predicted Zn-dependent peptidase